jgi:hypothetical protein
VRVQRPMQLLHAVGAAEEVGRQHDNDDAAAAQRCLHLHISRIAKKQAGLVQKGTDTMALQLWLQPRRKGALLLPSVADEHVVSFTTGLLSLPARECIHRQAESAQSVYLQAAMHDMISNEGLETQGCKPLYGRKRTFCRLASWSVAGNPVAQLSCSAHLSTLAPVLVAVYSCTHRNGMRQLGDLTIIQAESAHL